MFLIFIITGLLIRIFVIIQMKETYSMCIQQPKYLITKGWFKYIRHPSYVGTMLVVIGLILLSEKIALFYLTYMFLHARACQEDLINKVTFRNYSAYEKTTGKFIPKIFKK